MKTTIGAWALLALFPLASCQQNDLSEQGGITVLPLGIQAGVAETVYARTVTSSGGQTTFSADDKVGFFMPGEDTDVCWTCTGTGWKPASALYWANQEDAFHFCAYYPYTSGATRGSIPMPDLAGQTGKLEEIGRYDFLVAEKTCTYSDNGGQVAFTGNSAFSHTYSLLLVTLKKAEQDAETTLKTVCFEGDGITQSHVYSFSNAPGMLPSAGTGGDVLKLDLNESITDAGTQVAVLLNPSESERELPFTITYSRAGEHYKAGTQAMKSIHEPGKCYRYRVTIEKNSLVVEQGDITDWDTSGKLEDIVVNDTPDNA